MIKAVFFDFNGTLYVDHEINRSMWHIMIDEISDKIIDFDSYYKKHVGVMDYYMVEDAFKLVNKPYTKEDIEYYSNKKEEMYRQYGIDNKLTVLPPGAKDVLDYLKQNNIPVILCTSSIKENVEFYFKYFNLDNWFNFNQTIYDTGEYADKKEMYEECARRLNVDPKQALVFEDSPKSIREAIASGVDKVVALNTKDEMDYPEIKQRIKDFTELDYSIFK